MSIVPGTAKIGVPYLVEYEGEQWTGIRFRHVRPLSMGMLPPHLWQKETGTTAWIFLRYENDTGLISQQVMYAEDQAFGEIVPLVPSRNVTREEAHLTAEEAKAAHDNWMAASKRADRAEGKLYEARKDAEWYRNLALKGDQYAEELITERNELQAKLDAVEWIGDLPNPGDIEVIKTQGYWAQGILVADADATPEQLRISNSVNDSISSAARREAVARFIDAEEAKRNAEDEQRIEEQAKALAKAVFRYGGPWDNVAESARERCRAAIRAGWTPPESEA